MKDWVGWVEERWRRGRKGESKTNLISELYVEVPDLTLLVTWDLGVKGQLGAFSLYSAQSGKHLW